MDAAIWLQVGTLGCGRVFSCFLISSVFARTFERVLLSRTRPDASHTAQSFSYYRRSIEVSILIRRFPPLIISSLLFVVVYILVIIIVIRASSVFGSFQMVSRVSRSCPSFCSILPFQPPLRASASLALMKEGVRCLCSCLCCLPVSFSFPTNPFLQNV